MTDKTPIECVCSYYDQEPFKSAYSDEMCHCYECDAYNDGIEKGRQMERERVIKSIAQIIMSSGNSVAVELNINEYLIALKESKDV